MSKRLRKPAPPQPAAAVSTPAAAPAAEGVQQQSAPQMVQLPPLPADLFNAVCALIKLGSNASELSSRNLAAASAAAKWLEQAQPVEPASADTQPKPEA